MFDSSLTTTGTALGSRQESLAPALYRPASLRLQTMGAALFLPVKLDEVERRATAGGNVVSEAKRALEGGGGGRRAFMPRDDVDRTDRMKTTSGR